MQRIENLAGGEEGDMNVKMNNGPIGGSTAFNAEMTPQMQSFANSHDFQRIFDTPQSVMSSPQFDMFSSPFRGQFARAPATRCTLCNKDVIGRPIQFGCAHVICPSCYSMSGGRKCVICNSVAQTSMPSPQYPAQMFLSPNLTPEHLNADLADSSLNTSQHSYRSVNGLSTALQNVSMGVGELREPFNLWESSKNKLDTSMTFDTLSGGEDHPPVFSPVTSDSHFGLPPHMPMPTTEGISLVPHCAVCGTDSSAIAYCVSCRELLCSDCVVAHQRVRVTKDHPVISLEQLLQHIVSPSKDTVASGSLSGGAHSSDSSPRPSSVCGLHDSRVVGFCDSCSGAVMCFHCLPLHAHHNLLPAGDIRNAVSLLLAEAKQNEKGIDDAVESVCRMTERVDVSVAAVAAELRSVIHQHVGALEERKRELLQSLETIRHTKLQALKGQSEKLVSRKKNMGQTLKSLDQVLNCKDDDPQLLQAYEQLLAFFSQPLVLDPQETDQIKFIQPDCQLITKIRTMGELESGACVRTSSIMGDGFRRAIRERLSTVFVQLRDACGEASLAKVPNHVSATVLTPDGHSLDVQISDREAGVVAISYLPIVDGIHLLNILIRGVPISECPVNVDVRRGRNYGDIAARGELFSFGKEGSGDGELCRPWGICIDLRGRVLVADRSNNRIQVFDLEGNFITKFGSSGTRPGQFDRPAGIAVNTLNHIIVADKDNHRVQVFDDHGTFLLKFGERGRPCGMFNYPWGVATNSSNHVAVSDTRNHRVQIFNANGQFMRKCGFDSAFFYKHLDSPRGLCYLPDGQLLITDFNNHRLAILSTRTSDMKVYGSEGDADGLFCRPQGVKIDPEGHILVCDSRNNRIQVFSGDDMHCVAVFGLGSVGFQMPTDLPTPCQTSAPPVMMPFMGNASPTAFTPATPRQLDRPTDLAVAPDGRVYVVDFGNNCIRVY